MLDRAPATVRPLAPSLPSGTHWEVIRPRCITGLDPQKSLCQRHSHKTAHCEMDALIFVQEVMFFCYFLLSANPKTTHTERVGAEGAEGGCRYGPLIPSQAAGARNSGRPELLWRWPFISWDRAESAEQEAAVSGSPENKGLVRQGGSGALQ